jgi:hypothetical protein
MKKSRSESIKPPTGNCANGFRISTAARLEVTNEDHAERCRYCDAPTLEEIESAMLVELKRELDVLFGHDDRRL